MRGALVIGWLAALAFGVIGEITSDRFREGDEDQALVGAVLLSLPEPMSPIAVGSAAAAGAESEAWAWSTGGIAAYPSDVPPTAPPTSDSAPVRFTPADVLDRLETASPRARCIVRYEIGGYGYDPYVRGAQGERGPAQLASFGLLPLFERWSGGAEPENPEAAISFLEWALQNGYAQHWAPVVWGMC